MPLDPRPARKFGATVVSFPPRTSATQPPTGSAVQWQRIVDKLQRLVLVRPRAAAAILDGLEHVLDDRLGVDDTPAA
jgi:hypothetical protein